MVEQSTAPDQEAELEKLGLEVQSLLLSNYSTVPLFSKGKPQPQEWTVLAAIVGLNQKTKTLEVLSLATGTKSLPRS